MAKLIREFKGDFDEVIDYSKKSILEKNKTATLEHEVYYDINGIRQALLVFEKFYFEGGNRLSLTLNLIGFEDKLKLAAITAGGSQAMFFKINTVGEEDFLLKYRDYIDELIKRDNDGYVKKLYLDRNSTQL